MSEAREQICIVGGGFGGLYTALRLNQFSWEDRPRPKITLIDRHDRFLFSPLLYELVTDELRSWEIAPSFSELLDDTPIHFHRGTVTGIDLEARKIKLDNSPELCFERLAIAVGGKASLDFVPGAREHALPFRTLEDAYRLKDRLRELERSSRDRIRIAIIGGGYSGVEIACKLADRLGERGKIRIIEKTDEILLASPKFNRETARKALEKRRVWVDLETSVEEIRADRLSMNYKGQVDEIPVDLVLWAVGPIVSDTIADLPLAKGTGQRIRVNEYLQAIDRPDIYVLGDAADSRDKEDKPYPATAQVALQQADYCAWNLHASLTGKPLLPFRYQPLGEMLALGVNEATISGSGIQLDGGAAYLTRRLVYLYRLPTVKHQVTVGVNWLTEPIFAAIGQ
ncbi:NAD(P)/FAD-dependent oxidoreductase [Pannus brasiliensis CCIBt3594]|uniref:NAD(P)/FAD-dependent oxidoreductase n=1 Tax=Pannus brasiliensis CCIBt3594 TaxID=1427578 RepID=A0AAW9QJQ9_9CHRO